MTVPVGSLAAYMSVRGAAQARQDILSVQRSLGLTGETATAAGLKLDRAEAAIAGAGRAAGLASASTNKLRIAELGVVAATERYNAVLADENASVATLARANAGLLRSTERVAAITRSATVAQTGLTEATYAGSAAMRESAAASSRIGQATGGTVKQLGLLFGGYELLKQGIDISKESNAFQASMVRIRALTGASTADITDMSSALLKMSGPLATSPDELAKSLYHMVAIGLPASQALDAVAVAAKGAKIGNADLESTTNALTSTIATGIVKGKSFADTMSTILTIVGTGDMHMEQFNEALGTGLIAKMTGYGLSLTDVGAALAAFGDLNIRGADGATMLRMAVESFAKPAAGGVKALAAIGLGAKDLRNDMIKGGLNKAVIDLNQHLHDAGYNGKQVGGVLLDIFSKKGSAGVSQMVQGFERIQSKYKILGEGAQTLEQRWKETAATGSFAFKRLGAEAQSEGIQIFRNLTPAATGVAQAIGVLLPAALHAAGDALHPLIAGFHTLVDVLTPVAAAMVDVGRFLEPIAPIAVNVGVGVLSMWAAFKGFQIARAAVFALQDMFAAMQAKAANGIASMRAYGTAVDATLSGNATEAGLTSRIMQAEFAAIEASAMQAAAAIDRAAAVEAVAFADMTAASKAASDAQVASADRAAAAALAQSRASVVAAATTSAAAAETAAAVDTAGAEAAVGWGAILGPIAAVGIGVALLVSMFHRSSGASKEAAAAAKAYTDALKEGSESSLVDSITTQLAKNDVPKKIEDLNKALGTGAFKGAQFVTALQHGGPALATLRQHLEDVIKSGTQVGVSVSKAGGSITSTISPAAKAATKLLANLNDEFDGLSKATKKDLIDTAAFVGVSSSIDKVSQTTDVATASAKQYAAMSGIVVDKNGVAAVSAKTLASAVKNVGGAYDNATTTGRGFLDALSTFSQSAGTAADRGALIGATLKAANGDALSFAGSMVATSSATSALTDAFAQQAQQLQQQSAAQASAAEGVTKARRGSESAAARLAAAEARLRQVRGNPKSTAAQIASAEATVTAAQNTAANSAESLASAQTAAGQAGALAYKDTERAALKFTGTGAHMTATIKTAAKGAGDLVSQLQAMQDAAMAAASAMFQHEKETKGAKQAADDAYQVYVQKTRGALIDQAKKLHLTKDQAKALADEYFGIKHSGDIKKTIEAEGTDKILDVLTKIGKLLAHFTGQPWDIPVRIKIGLNNDHGKAVHDAVNDIGPIAASSVHDIFAGVREGGGPVKAGRAYVVGEKRPELFVPKTDGMILPHVPTGGVPDNKPAGGKQVTIEKFEQNINYHGVGEPAARVTARGLVMAEYEMARAI